MLVVHCNVHTTPDGAEDFLRASLANAKASRQEPGCQVFECYRSIDDPTVFVLVEHYDGPEDLDFHKTQPHYLAWKEGVADLMAEPRNTVKYQTV